MSKTTKMLKKVIGMMMVVCMLAASLAVPAYAAPVLTLENTIASHDAPGTAAVDMCISDKYAFVAYEYSYKHSDAIDSFVGQTFTAYYAWVEVWDIQTEPKNPTYLTSVSAPSGDKYNRYPYHRIYDVAVKGNYLLINCYNTSNSTGNKMVKFYDVSNVTKDAVLEEVAFAGYFAGVPGQQSNMIVDGDTLVVLSAASKTGKNSIDVYDISDASIMSASANPDPLRRYLTSQISVDYAVATNNGEYGVGRYSAGCLDGDYLYYTSVSTSFLDLFVADISNNEFKLLSKYRLVDYGSATSYNAMASAVCAQGDYVYVLTNGGGSQQYTDEEGTKRYFKNQLYILDVSATKNTKTNETPTAPTLTGRAYPGGTINENSKMDGMAVNGSFVYIWASGTAADNGMQMIHMYDVSDKTNPERITRIAQTTTGGTQHAICLKDNLIYSCASTNGLLVHSVTANEITEPVVTNAAGEGASLADTSLAATATVTNYSASPYNGMLIMARYDGDELLGVETNMFTVPAGTKAREIETEALTAEGGTAAKAMLWKNSIIPVKIRELLAQ